MKKRFILPTIIAASVLTACGGGSSSDSDSGGDAGVVQPTSKKITVIDGYLQNVAVYADRNMDSIASNDELVGQTDENGQVTLQLTDEGYSLIAKVAASESIDSDRIGAVTRSFSLNAPVGSDVITPFTTLLSDITLDELSATLNLSSELLSGDYIAMKASDTDAIVAHAVARTIVDVVANASGSVSAEEVIIALNMVMPEINDYIGVNGVEALDTVTFGFDNGQIEVEQNHTDLDGYFGAVGRWNMASINSSHLAGEGVQYVEFNTDERTLDLFDRNGIYRFTQEYLFDGTRLVVSGSGGSSDDNFIAITRDIAVAKTRGAGDLIIWSKDDIAYPFTQTEIVAASEFSGEEWYMISDDSSTTSPDNIVATMSFSELGDSPEGSLVITEGSESFDSSYYVTTEQTQSMGVIAPLVINLGEDDRPLKLIQVSSSESVRVMYEMNRNMYVIMTNEKELAFDIVSAF